MSDPSSLKSVDFNKLKKKYKKSIPLGAGNEIPGGNFTYIRPQLAGRGHSEKTSRPTPESLYEGEGGWQYGPAKKPKDPGTRSPTTSKPLTNWQDRHTLRDGDDDLRRFPNQSEKGRLSAKSRRLKKNAATRARDRAKTFEAAGPSARGSSKPIYGPKKPPVMGKTMTFTPKETAGDAEYYDKMRKTRIGRSKASPAKAKPGPWQKKWRARQRQKAGGKGTMAFTRKEVVPEQEAAIAKARRNRGA
jgi:hypothetical protein